MVGYTINTHGKRILARKAKRVFYFGTGLLRFKLAEPRGVHRHSDSEDIGRSQLRCLKIRLKACLKPW